MSEASQLPWQQQTHFGRHFFFIKIQKTGQRSKEVKQGSLIGRQVVIRCRGGRWRRLQRRRSTAVWGERSHLERQGCE